MRSKQKNILPRFSDNKLTKSKGNVIKQVTDISVMRKILMIPGPIEYENNVLNAMSLPTMSHSSKEFVSIFRSEKKDSGCTFSILSIALFPATPTASPVITPVSPSIDTA